MLRGREGMLYFVFNSDVIAVVVAHNIGQGEFVAQVSTALASAWLPTERGPAPIGVPIPCHSPRSTCCFLPSPSAAD